MHYLAPMRARRLVAAIALPMSLVIAFTTGASAAPRGPLPTSPLRHRLVAGDCSARSRLVCGYVEVPRDRRDPSAGSFRIYFQRYLHSDPTRPALEPIVAVEGGPGYSTVASASSYLDLFAPILDRRDLILVDNRGTGRSAAINCPALQSYRGPYNLEVARCGERLGEASDLYGSHQAADDLADVLTALGIEKVDLYGDSYGTFFSQTFAVRHPDRLRSVVLDSAYWVQWTDPWYSDTNRADVEAFRLACRRWPTCAPRGDGMDRILRLLEVVRRTPIVGEARDADGNLRRVRIDPGTVGQLMTDAATSPDIYREMDAAIRAALASPRDTLPLLRLLAENTWWYSGGPVEEYSEGLYIAVSCNDYPLAYDRTAPTSVRRAQYRDAIQGLKANDPDVFWPFTVDEWVTYPDHYWDSCLGWPAPSRLDPPVPPHAAYPDVPVLVLSGDLDSLTSPEGARATAAAFPNSTFVSVANMTHVAALGDFGRCASDIVIRFVRTLVAGDTSCASRYAPNRLVDTFAVHARDLGIASDARRTAVVAADTVADVVARWWDMFGSDGVGLRMGSFTADGLDRVTFRLQGVGWVRDVAVDGTIHWDRTTGEIEADVRVSGPGAVPGSLSMSWSDWAQLPRAHVTGTLGGHSVSYAFLAP